MALGVYSYKVLVLVWLESTGVPGKIQVTQEVLDLVPPGEFEFERRGIVHVKGKGEMETFFLTGRRREEDRVKYSPMPPKAKRTVSKAIPVDLQSIIVEPL